MVKEIDQKPLDMVTILILIRHDHDMFISQRIGCSVALPLLQTDNGFYVLKFSVFVDDIIAFFLHI